MAGATAFLTRVPGLPRSTRVGAPAFALVGAGMGLVVALPAGLLLPVSPLLAAATAIALLALLDGALHLDGVADSADALAAPTPEARERARKDSSIGAAGAVALVLVLLLQVAALAAVPQGAFVVTVVIAGAASRSVPVLGALLVRTSGPTLGGWWSAAVRRRDAGICLVTCLLVALLLPASTLAALLLGLALGLAALLLISRTVGVSGDAFGAAIELGFLGAVTGSALAASLL